MGVVYAFAIAASVLAAGAFLTRKAWYPTYLDASIINAVLRTHNHYSIASRLSELDSYAANGCTIIRSDDGVWSVMIDGDDVLLPPFIETLRNELLQRVSGRRRETLDVPVETARLAAKLLNTQFGGYNR